MLPAWPCLVDEAVKSDQSKTPPEQMEGTKELKCQAPQKQRAKRFACKHFGKEEDLEIYKNNQAHNKPLR